MWPFRRKHQAIENLAAVSSWSVGQGTLDDKPCIVSVNSAAAAFLGHPELASVLRVVLSWDMPNRGGMPNPVESWTAREFEDALLATIQHSNEGILVAIITVGEFREFVSYIRDGSSIRAQIEELKRTYPAIRYTIAEDPSWKTYRRLRMK